MFFFFFLFLLLVFLIPVTRFSSSLIYATRSKYRWSTLDLIKCMYVCRRWMRNEKKKIGLVILCDCCRCLVGWKGSSLVFDRCWITWWKWRLKESLHVDVSILHQLIRSSNMARKVKMMPFDLIGLSYLPDWQDAVHRSKLESLDPQYLARDCDGKNSFTTLRKMWMKSFTTE